MADEREVVELQVLDAVGEILGVGGELRTRRALGEAHARQVECDDRPVRAGDEGLPATRAVHEAVHEDERAPAPGPLPVGQEAAIGQDQILGRAGVHRKTLIDAVHRHRERRRDASPQIGRVCGGRKAVQRGAA
jgi:hypothetical protein